ncbi:MAG: cytochrome c [Phycisphaerales bacterium]
MHRHNLIVSAAASVALLALPACSDSGSGHASARAVRHGALRFSQTCKTCHGPDAKGLPNLGKDLTISEFFRTNSDEDLLAFVKAGRVVENGTSMPPRGGYTDLTDNDIRDIIAYLRTLEQPAPTPTPAP